MEGCVNTREAAEFLGISTHYLRNMRHCMHNHEGPEYTAVSHARGNGACEYKVKDLIKWAQNHKWKVVKPK